MDEHEGHGIGMEDAYRVNMKMVVEDVLKFRAALDAQYLADIARIREIGHESLENHNQDMRDAKMRKETSTEERSKELEEVFNKVVTAGANQQSVGINEAIAGITAILEASGLLSAVVGGSQQTSGRTGKGKYD